ncbi:hypothetical protein HGB46_17600 [Nocardiopsis dassonvillei]|nr:hypothetical protein [Nocardiopsis dassonvillei]
MSRARHWVCAAVLTGVVAGCGSNAPEETGGGETMNQDEAAENVQEHIDKAVTVLPETLELQPVGGVNVAACDDPTDGGSGDRVTVGRSYWLDGLPVEDNEANIDLLTEYWTANGYRVLTDSRPDDVFVSVENEEDAFRMSVQASVEGHLSIGASSPCVWPEGTPDS